MAKINDDGTINPWVCPKCKMETTDYPALSREDNETHICSACGMAEALNNLMNNKVDKK